MLCALAKIVEPEAAGPDMRQSICDKVDKYPMDDCFTPAMPVCCSVEGCTGVDCIDLTEREAQGCAVICSSAEPVSFTEVRKVCNFHQSIVSRILRRLVIHGVIEKSVKGYRRSM
jgi:hypothetical protein